MSQNIELSIVVPIKNMSGRLQNLAKTILPAIDSGAEIIFVFDGCEDETEKDASVIFGDNYSKIKVCQTLGVGPGAARNIGHKLATRDWIVFWDSDDLGLIDGIKRIINSQTSKTFDVLIARYKVLGRNLEPQSSLSSGSSRADSLNRVAMNPGIWRMVFRREAIQDIRFGSGCIGEDQVFLARVLTQNPRIQFRDETIYKYCVGNPEQITSKKIDTDDISKSIKELLAVIPGTLTSIQTPVFIMFFRLILTQLKAAKRSNSFFEQASLVAQHAKTLVSLKQVKALNGLWYILWFRFKGKKNKVNMVFLTGGLGNQLFQISAALSLTNDRMLIVDSVNGNPRVNELGFADSLDFSLNELNTQISSKHFNLITRKAIGYCLRKHLIMKESPLQHKVRKVALFLTSSLVSIHYRQLTALRVCTGLGYDADIKESRLSTLFVGYFQSYRWLESMSTPALSLFELSHPSKTLADFKKLSETEKPLVVHIRLGDYLLENGFGTPSKDYYAKALERASRIGDFGKIWLFSDEPEKAIKHLPENPGLEIRVMPDFGGSSSKTLEALKFGRGYVIANSTFSWWGATLSYEKDPLVIYPYPWFKSLGTPLDLVSPRWIPMSAT